MMTLIHDKIEQQLEILQHIISIDINLVKNSEFSFEEYLKSELERIETEMINAFYERYPSFGD